MRQTNNANVKQIACFGNYNNTFALFIFTFSVCFISKIETLLSHYSIS